LARVLEARGPTLPVPAAQPDESPGHQEDDEQQHAGEHQFRVLAIGWKASGRATITIEPSTAPHIDPVPPRITIRKMLMPTLT